MVRISVEFLEEVVLVSVYSLWISELTTVLYIVNRSSLLITGNSLVPFVLKLVSKGII